jgi:ubiquinone/menaquinone biosynthesis C-methylase UbiE
MAASDQLFAGSIPEIYERLLVPLIFEPYAADLADRVAKSSSRTILETAAGTGVVTRAMAANLPRNARIVATDLNQPMLDVAQEELKSDRVRFQQADAQQLPFEDGSFDLVVCQFGAMFFPDKVNGHAEAYRALRSGGHYLLAIWDAIGRNALSDVTQRALIDLFPEDPPTFLCDGPFGYSDPARIESDLHDAGFQTVEIETVELSSRSASAYDAASALCYGTPMSVELEDREPGSLDRAFEEVERSLRRFEGANGIDAPMSAHIVTATK